MNKYDLVNIIENFAPLELQEKWDSSGWVVETQKKEVSKVLIALTVTEEVFNQALNNNCDMIISHHPLFFVPLDFQGIDIYCAHTNMDKTNGGTTDILVKELGLNAYQEGEFLRVCEDKFSINDLANKIKKVSPNARIINKENLKEVSKIAFCAGSGMDLYNEVIDLGCDCFVTGDLKYHSAVDSKIVLFDVGHFESEVLIKKVFQDLIKDKIDCVIASETTPFMQISEL